MNPTDPAFHATNTPAPVATGRRKYVHTAKYQPMFDEAQAREIVLCRMDEINSPKGPRPLHEFAQRMYEYGLTRKVASVSLMSRLLTGAMLPNLTDREGRPFLWDKVPRATRGRRATGRGLRTTVRKMQREIDQLAHVVRVLCDRAGLDLNPYDVANESDDTVDPDTPIFEAHDSPTQRPIVPKVRYVDDLPVIVTPEDDAPQPSVPPPRRS